MKDATGVVFAPSASGKKKGGDPAHDVDYLGVYKTANACLECGVPTARSYVPSKTVVAQLNQPVFQSGVHVPLV